MKTALQELIERLEEKIKICNSNNLEREAMGMLEAKAIATELLEKEREREEEIRNEVEEKYNDAVEWIKSFEQKAYDAWKPVQMFRTDKQVEDDEIRMELLEAINEEAKAIIQDLNSETFKQNK